MKPGHAAFGKAASQPKHPGRSKEVGGGLLVADAAANAPVLRTGAKSPRKMVSASPKRQAGRYQGELVGAMKEGKVPSNSTLRVLKTPSGRYLNAGGTHRHLAREAMGQGTPEHKIEVKSLGFEPRQSLVERAVNRSKVAQLSRASRRAVAGKPMKPVSAGARSMNHVLAHAADANDDAFWNGIPKAGGVASHIKEGADAAHRARLGGSAALAGLGVGLAGLGALEHHASKKKQGVVKAVNGHDGFEVSKRDFSAKQRRKLASKGDALPDGSFPIKTKGDLKNAERLEGKSKHPAEVAAFIERRKAELSKSATGHDAFLLEDVEKAFSLGGAMDAVKGVGAIGRGVMKQPGILKPGAGAHRGAGKIGGALKPLVMKPGGGLTTGAKVAGGAAGMGVGYKAGMGIRHQFGS